MLVKSCSRVSLVAAFAGAAIVASPLSAATDPVPSVASHQALEAVSQELPFSGVMDDSNAVEVSRKLGLDRYTPGTLRGLPVCPDITFDTNNCHPAEFNLGAAFSNTGAGNFRVAESIVPASQNPTRICWTGRYENRVVPAVADESFVITIWNNISPGFPDLAAGPIFQREFRQSGAAGNNLLEMDCLDGQSCPGTSTPAAGGHYIYSIEVAGGFPMDANGCYWIEIACSGSASAGLRWGWVASLSGTDNTSIQAIDGAYSLFTRSTNDRAICVSGGTNQFFGGCQIGPTPPVCSNDAANGIAYDGTTGSGARSSFVGSVGRTGTGAWTPFQRAENFSFGSQATVSSVCFNGFWNGVNDAGTTVAVTPPENPGFRIAYYSHEPIHAIPGAAVPFAEFALGDPGVSFVWNGSTIVNMTHPPVTFEPNTCYWISIGRVQSQQAVGAPVNPLWQWRLTTGASPSADGRQVSREVSATAVGAWTRTVFRQALAQNCEPQLYNNYVFLFNDGPTIARDCGPVPCSITIPPDAAPNPEPNCALSGNLNGGCNLANPVFTPIACNETVHGSSSNLVNMPASCGLTRDTDWFQFTVTQETEVTLTVTSQFPGIAGFSNLVAGVTNPTGLCSELSGILPFVNIGGCTPVTLTRTIAPGTWTLFVGAIFSDVVSCDGVNNNYVMTLTCGGGPVVDCNGNGIPDSQEIAANPALDCYNPTVVQNPHVMGGADGIIDACQCAANWNRDAQVNSTDLSTFITSWLAAVNGQTTGADINCSGTVNSTDLSAFITLWLSALNNTVPFDGCP